MKNHTDYLSLAQPKEPAVDTIASERLLRLPQIMELVGLRRGAIYHRMREGRIPKSRSLRPRCTV